VNQQFNRHAGQCIGNLLLLGFDDTTFKKIEEKLYFCLQEEPVL